MSRTNGVMYQTFTWTADASGSFWNTILVDAPALAEVGFTALWLPPPCKAQGGVDDIGYGIYDLYDLGEFEQKGTTRTRYGTREEFIACVQAANDAGLLTLADIVLNHRMGADEIERFLAVKVDPNNRSETVGEPIELEAWTRFNFEGRGDQYGDFRWRWHHFNAVDYAENGDDDQSLYRVMNKNFADDVGDEHGNYDFLMGCNVHLQQPDVREELIRWGRWFVEQTGIGGFRVDAAKHMSAGFLKDFMDATRASTDRELYAVGEYAIDDAEEIGGFVEQTDGAIQCFDFPLHFSFSRASKAGADFDLRTLFDGSLVAAHPAMAVTFVDNHDSDPAQDGDHWVQDWFKPMAYACLLLRRDGFPCVFAGDYHGRDDEGLELNSFKGELDQLLELRRRFNHGDQHDYFADPHRIAWVRTGDAEHHGAMVVTLNNAEAGEIRLNTHRPGVQFITTSCDGDSVMTDDDGVATFPCPAGGYAVWTTTDGVPE